MRALAFVLLLTTTAHAQWPDRVTGLPTVTDGDTLVIRETRIRLFSVDAPESSQTCTRVGKSYGCGREAASALADLIHGKTVTCLRRDTDRYGRMVAVCTLGSIEINRWLVEQGHALPYLAYGGRIYQDAERQAKETRRGLHAGVFQAPWEYRRNPASPPTAGTPRAVPASRVVYANCAAARAAGAAPVRVGQPGYGRHLDRDGDGVGCS